MGLTNEQRAHDLAVASLPFVRDLVKADNANGIDTKFDVYFEYKKLYEMFLESLEQDETFSPNQKDV